MNKRENVCEILFYLPMLWTMLHEHPMNAPVSIDVHVLCVPLFSSQRKLTQAWTCSTHCMLPGLWNYQQS